MYVANNSSKQPTSNSEQPTQNGTQAKSNFKQHKSNSLKPNNDSKQPKSNSIRLNCPSKHPTSNGKQPEMRVNSLEVKQISQSQEKKINILDKKIDDYSLHHLFP